MPSIFVADILQNASNVHMKTFSFILAILTFAIQLPADDANAPALPKAGASAPLKIGAAEASNHYDQEMIVTGKIAQVTIRPTVTFLNLDKAFPNSPFSVVIFPGRFIPGLKSLEGKSIEIKGKIKNYQDKPEIVLDSTNQLTVFDPKGVNITSAILQSTNHAPVMPQPPNAVPAPPATTPTNFPEIM